MEYKVKYYDQDGVKRTSIYDEENPNQLRVYTEVEMDAVLESIKRTRDEVEGSKSPNKILARVPMTVMEKSIHENWDDDDWKKWLNDPDNAHFRVWRGQV